MTKARINGIDIDYQEYGEGEVIVFAHGAGGNLLSWWQQIPFFSQSYRCVTFSHRGFGHSVDAPGGPGADAFVDDLEGLLDHLEVESAHLVAQSMGGRTMLGFALTHAQRARSLVMADTFGTIAEPELLELVDSWREANPASGELALRAYAPSFHDREPDLASLYVQISRTNPPRPALSVGPPDGPMAAELGAMKVPTLFIVGEEDRIAPPHVIEAAAGYVPGSRVTRIPGAGHSVYFEKPDIFNFEVARFLRSQSAGSA